MRPDAASHGAATASRRVDGQGRSDKSLGWRFDGDFADGGGFRVVQMTPHNSQASIIFGKGIRSAQPGLADSLVLAVDNVEAAREDLLARVAGRDPSAAPNSRSPRSRARTGTHWALASE